MYYSKQTGCTYLPAIHGDQMPADAVPISNQRYLDVIANPVQGKVRDHDAEGLPILVDPLPNYPQMIASARYDHEVAGVTVDGLSIETDRDTRNTILDKALAAVVDPAYFCNLKTATGFVEVNAAQILTISSAIRSYVQRCFDREEELLVAVQAGTYSGDMLGTGWPSQIFKTPELPNG